MARGEGRVFLRGKTWWIAYWGPQNGTWKEIRESAESGKESVARKLLRTKIADISNHRRGIRQFQTPAHQRLTIAELLDALKADYIRREIKSLSSTLNHSKMIREFFGHFRAIDVTSDLITRYIETRKAEKLSNAKINRELEILGAAFSLAQKQEVLVHKPYITHLPENNARTGFFEQDEHERIVQHLRSPMDDIARFAYVSGWRKEEIRPLRWENVDRGAKEVRLDDSKNSSPRLLPLDEDTWALFVRLYANRMYDTADGPVLSEYVFHRGDGQPVSKWYFEELWANAREAASLPGKLFHDYRRTAARNMIRAGVPQTVAMAITGHKTDSMFRRYNITTSDDKRDALRKQLDYLKALPASNVAEFRQNSDNSRTSGSR